MQASSYIMDEIFTIDTERYSGRFEAVKQIKNVFNDRKTEEAAKNNKAIMPSYTDICYKGDAVIVDKSDGSKQSMAFVTEISSDKDFSLEDSIVNFGQRNGFRFYDPGQIEAVSESAYSKMVDISLEKLVESAKKSAAKPVFVYALDAADMLRRGYCSMKHG
jgi:hypothetical protein